MMLNSFSRPQNGERVNGLVNGEKVDIIPNHLLSLLMGVASTVAASR
jgi:hypothetical protein